MRNLIAATLVGGILACAAVAAADALPSCPEGQHMEPNPTSPGAQHHNGGRCVQNESSGCATAGSAASAAAGIALVGLIAWHRRRPRS